MVQRAPRCRPRPSNGVKKIPQADKEERGELYQAACEALISMGYEASVHENYSGRGMYGDTCTGIVCDAAGPIVGWAICEAWWETHDVNDDGPCPRKFIPARSDSMGREMIYY